MTRQRSLTVVNRGKLAPSSVMRGNSEDPKVARSTPTESNPMIRCRFCDWARPLQPVEGSKNRKDGWAALRSHVHTCHRSDFDQIASWAHEETQGKGRRPIDGERIAAPVWGSADDTAALHYRQRYEDAVDSDRFITDSGDLVDDNEPEYRSWRYGGV